MSKDEEHVWPAAIPVDATIRELRHYFRLLEIKQIKSEIDDRIRLARAAESEARQATKEAKRARKAAKKKLSFKKAPPLPEIKLMRHCFRCGADMPDLDPSALPKPCRKCDEAERSYVGPVKPRTVTAFLEIDVFKGGAPGSGKRR